MTNKKVLRWLRSHKVAVLKGGWSRERPISLKTASAVEASLKRLKIPFCRIDVGREFLKQMQSHPVDFCFIALHGEFGEDGGVQALLDLLNIPYTGSGARGSALAMNKTFSKKRFKKSRIPTPAWLTLDKKSFLSSKIKSIRKIAKLLKRGSLFVKPTDQGSAIGAGRVDQMNQISTALKNCFRVSEEALVERFIDGRELTVGILGEKTLPIVEIIPKHSFYDFHSKYAKGGSRHLIPAPLSRSIEKKAKSLSKKAFQALDCAVYGRVDLLLGADGRLHVLEVNTIPGMTNTSLLPEAAKSNGLSFDDLVIEIVRLSLQERGILK